MDPSIIFFGIGFALFLFGAYRVLFGYLSLTWPTVSGELIFSRIELRINSRNQGTSATLHLKYRYSVSGHEYIGHRFCFGNASAHSHAIATHDLVEVT